MEFNHAFPKIIVVAISAILSLSSLSAVSQEDGTGGSLPESFHQCELVEANWSASSSSPEASPISSPVASPVATPVVESDPLGDDLQAATHAILDCMSDNNLDVLLKVTGPEFRATWLGYGTSISDSDFSAILPMMPNLPYALVGIDNVTAEGNDATATVTFTTGRQLTTSEWNYELTSVDGQSIWKVNSKTILPTETPEDASTLAINVSDGSYELNPSTVKSGNIVINVSNTGELPHEVLIIRAPTSTEAADYAAAPNGIPDGGTFIGQVTIPAGTEGSIVLTDVRSGTYTVVDLLPNENGIPNVSNGMITEFTVD